MTKEPFNPFNEMMKMFDRGTIDKMFDPASLMAQFGAKAEGVDPQDMLQNAKDQFAAMSRANEQAATAYRELLEKQMQIFQTLTSDAAERLKDGSAADAPEVYQQAVKRALELMTELSQATAEASQTAYAEIRDQVEQAIKSQKG